MRPPDAVEPYDRGRALYDSSTVTTKAVPRMTDAETPARADGTTELFTAIGRQLKILRERAGLTQKELGTALGYRPDLSWFKSSYSGGAGGECLEVAYDWRKSSYSDGEGGQCVEVAASPRAVRVRDSKNPAGPQLALSPGSWSAFLAGGVLGDRG